MSTLTSLMGMLPLVVAPGAGSVIYKGLATVIVGGMAVSTLFTLVLLPCLLRLEPIRLEGLKQSLGSISSAGARAKTWLSTS